MSGSQFDKARAVSHFSVYLISISANEIPFKMISFNNPLDYRKAKLKTRSFDLFSDSFPILKINFYRMIHFICSTLPHFAQRSRTFPVGYVSLGRTVHLTEDDAPSKSVAIFLLIIPSRERWHGRRVSSNSDMNAISLLLDSSWKVHDNEMSWYLNVIKQMLKKKFAYDIDWNFILVIFLFLSVCYSNGLN